MTNPMTAREIRILRAAAVTDKDDLMIRLCDTALQGMGGLTAENFTALETGGPLCRDLVLAFQNTYSHPAPVPVADFTAWLNGQIETATKHDDQDWVDAARQILAGVEALQAVS